ncbi:MAG TPA: HEAT repeat domain-containing protein [Polyangiaceae bacterium]|nr:HEAT repeat domain-containing protein [Polyangiaceae bacterium]
MSEAASAVRWLLDQAEPEARRIAVQQIAKVRGREAPELLLRALGDDDWRVRKEGTLVAPVLDRREEVIAVLIAALEETVNIGLRNAAVDALVAVGPDAVGGTIDALGRFGPDARKLAIEVLGGIAHPRGTYALADALSDEDANVSVAAAEALGGAALAGEESREHATRALVGVLGASNVFLKIAALDSLSRLSARLPWSVFEPFVHDPLLRRYAVAAAAGSREVPAVRALALATSDPSPTISRDALVALGDLLAGGPVEDALIAAARRALDPAGHDNARRAARDAEDSRARAGALLVLGLMQDIGDVPLLVDALGDDEVAQRADMAVRLFGPSIVRPLLATARDAAAPLQAVALSLAASLEGADASEIRSESRESLKSQSIEVTSCAVEVLGAIGDATDLRRAAQLVAHADERIAAAATTAVSELAARHVEAARELLRESRPPHDPVVLGCILLGAIASTQPLLDEDVHLLERALEHDDPQVRRAAIDALAQTGGSAAADAVVFALSDEEREVQLAAVRALGRLGRSEPLVGIVMDARDPVLMATSLRALGEADPHRAMRLAGPLVLHADPAIACAAIEAVGQLDVAAGPESSAYADREDVLFAALDHSDVEVVKLSLSLVGLQPGPRALIRLGLCLDHSSRDVRCMAAELLAQDKSAAAQKLLRVRYEREKDPTVRDAIAHAVSVRSPPDVASGERLDSAAATAQGAKVG